MCWLASASCRLLSWISSNSRTFSIAIAAWSAKVDDQLDLLVAERPHLEAGQGQHADRHALAQHRHAEQGAKAAQALRLGKGVIRIGQHVGNMHDFAFEQSATVHGAAFRLDRQIPDHFEELGRETVGLGAIEHAVFLARDRPLVGLAKPRRGLDQRLQHGREVERRAADDLEHVGGRGLLLQGFAEFAGAFLLRLEQPHVLDRDGRLVGEGGGKLDLLVGERAHLGASYDNDANGLACADKRDG